MTAFYNFEYNKYPLPTSNFNPCMSSVEIKPTLQTGKLKPTFRLGKLLKNYVKAEGKKVFEETREEIHFTSELPSEVRRLVKWELG